MGRKRRRDKHLPKRVDVHHGSYRYRPKVGKPITLCRVGKYGDMLRELARILDGDHPELDTMRALFDRYEIEIVPKKAASTHKDQSRMLENLRRSFKMAPRDLRQPHAAKYRDKRGQKAPTAANRELELLSHVCTMAVEWGAMELNPLRGLRKIGRGPRDRYVTDEEYAFVHGLASPMVRCVLDLALLTGLRRKDIFRLSRASMTDDGLVLQPSKTQRTSRVNLLFEWTPALRKVVDDALALPPSSDKGKVVSISGRKRQHIVCNRKAEPYTKNGFDSVWQRLMDKATDPKRDKHIERFQFKDMRRKSASDEVDELVASRRLGHSSVEITNRVYRVKPKKVRPLR